MSATATERRYQMTRLGKGDYLLPSNDAGTLWRLSTYYEDGSAETWTGRKIVGTFWAVWKWDGGFPTLDQLAAAMEDEEEFGDRSRWMFWAGPFETRAAAVEEALGARV